MTEFLRLHGPIQLASTDTECWSCHRQTRVHALLAQDLEDFETGEEPVRVESKSFVYDIADDGMPSAMAEALAARALNYAPTFSRTTSETTWANRCGHCDALQGAFFMHGEPDGPFFGGPENFQGDVELLSDVGFDVADASYSV